MGAEVFTHSQLSFFGFHEEGLAISSRPWEYSLKACEWKGVPALHWLLLISQPSSLHLPPVIAAHNDTFYRLTIRPLPGPPAGEHVVFQTCVTTVRSNCTKIM